MISRLGLAISRVFEKTAPDPLIIAILLTTLTAALALAFGTFPAIDSAGMALWRSFSWQGFADRSVALLDSWRLGIWKLLEFAMQMCLILVTGHALALARPVNAVIKRVAHFPKSTATAAAMVSLIACATALVNWGLGLIVGALLARDVGRSMQERGIRANYPLIVAAGYTGLMVWHGGLSGSAPLSMTTPQQAARAISPVILERIGLQDIGVGLDQTVFSWSNVFISGGLLMLAPVTMALLAGAPPSNRQWETGNKQWETGNSQGQGSHCPLPIAHRLENSAILAMFLAVPLLLGLWRFAYVSGGGGWRTIGLNEVNAAMLALGLLLHGSPRSYMAAVEQGIRGCAGIVVQFPIYAGIMAMMTASGLAKQLAEAFTHAGNQSTVPLLSFLAASVINLFIPSGGGQWAVQGPVALMAGYEVGVAPSKMIMSVAYGDQLTNMLQPFWALPLLAITGVKAREIVGYCSIVMVIGGLWIALGLATF
jgi:short-chain fatty acids transporter